MVARRVLILLLLYAGGAQAGECAPIAGAGAQLGQVDAQVRLRFVRDRMRQAAHKMRIWAWTFAGIYSTLTVGNLALLAGADRHGQIDDGVGAAASFVGVLTIAILPPEIIADDYWLERRLRRAPPGTDPCALLTDAERLFVRDAKSVAFGKSAMIHAGNFVFNIGIGLLLGLGFGHWQQAMIQGLIGIAVGEAMIISQPAEIVTDLRRYRAANLGLPPAWRPVAWGVAPLLGDHRAGLMLGLSF
jgi:hypothetical protein